MIEATEHELVERCRRGDDTAFRELVDRYKGLVYALASRGTTTRERADDLAQEVFLRVHRGLPYFRGEARLSTWIYRITAHLLAEQRPDPPSVSIDAPADVGGLGHEPAATDRRFDDLITRDRVEKAIRRLPAHYQVLVNGHYLQGLRYEDLADALGLPIGTVKTHLHRAKRQLRAWLSTDAGTR